MELTQLLPYSGLLLSAYATWKSHFVSREQAKRDAEFEVMKKQLGLFWGLVEKHMTTVLHSPHTPDLDRLLEKYQEGDSLEMDEVEELAHRLIVLINDGAEQQGNRAGAVFLLAALAIRYDLDIDPCIEGE
jgi:hypothetical protein